ncbi:MAG: M48 family metalloprotease, partial [Candidatus Binatia bacterium]
MEKMMMRVVASLSILCCLLAPPALAQTTDNLDETLRRLPPQQQALYRQQLLRFERVARRVLQVVPNPPQVNFLLAAGEQSINAGATHGKVIVSEGMMRFVRSDDELAMILGHELAHLTEGHVSRGAVSNTLLGLGSAIVGTLFPGGDLATGLVGQMVLNRFNQTQEREADRVGLRYVYQAGYDPQAAVRVMERMAEEVPETATAG